MSSREITEWVALAGIEHEERLQREADARSHAALEEIKQGHFRRRR